jgi:hypothetical protein
MSKPNILFVGNYNRRDYIDLLLKSKGDFNFFFLEFASKKEITNHYYENYGKAIFWGNYYDVYDLLHQIKPYKVLFLFIESYYHVLLNLACKSKKIPTYHLEHGLRADYSPTLHTGDNTIPSQSFLERTSGLRKKLSSLRAWIKSRLFLFNSIKVLSEEDTAFLKEFIRVRSQHDHLETFKRIKSNKRTAKAYISFSPKVFEVHQLYDHLGPAQKVYFIGIPYFDAFPSIAPQQSQNAILLIDQPLVENKLLNWTLERKLDFMSQLVQICSEHKFRLYIKPHPSQDVRSLKKFISEGQVTLINDKEMAVVSKSTPLVLGFYSTLLMPLAAFIHTTVITYENHPIGNYLVSKSYVEAGVAHPIYNLEELRTILPRIEELHQKQLPHKAKFIQEWMYKFDGKAGERLRDILLSKDL